MTRRFWNEDVETLPPAALRKLENARLQTQLEYVWASSLFYQAKFSSVGVKRTAIRDLADLPLLPFTEKDEIRQNQQEPSSLWQLSCHDTRTFDPRPQNLRHNRPRALCRADRQRSPRDK